MSDLTTTSLFSAVLGFVAGAVVVLFGFSAVRGFISVYCAALVAIMLMSLPQVPLVLAILATLVLAVFSFFPAAGGFVAGAWLAKAMLGQKNETGQNAP